MPGLGPLLSEPGRGGCSTSPQALPGATAAPATVGMALGLLLVVLGHHASATASVALWALPSLSAYVGVRAAAVAGS